MKALVIGQGGREHALARALRLSKSISEVHAIPGSEGMKTDAHGHAMDWRDTSALTSFCTSEKIDFVIIGPEVPLVEGLADRLRAAGVECVGPSGEAALLEGSKIYCKDFLIEANVPTAYSKVVDSVASVEAVAHEFTPPYVLKADGLAAGKGVFICKTLPELREAARSIFEEKSLGEAGARALLEQFSPGYEISYLVLTNGARFEALPLAQDHKRLLDGDEGPNTGGMGVVAPVPIDATLRERIDREVLEPTMALFRKRGYVYRGCLFVGLMITDQGPSVLEFNTRFGDPETQAILPLLDGDWGQTFASLAKGEMKKLSWKNASSCCVVLAAEGYPDAPVKGAPIDGLKATGEASATIDSSVNGYVLHAGTQLQGSAWATSGGRVLNTVSLGANLPEAIRESYALARTIKWSGLQMRADIGARQV